jgi:hypothetical protein
MVASTNATAQFKTVGPPPFPEPIARARIRMLLEDADASNRKQTVDALLGVLPWYRDVLDDELIAAWKKNPPSNLADLMSPLADPRVASAVVDYSWRQQRQATFAVAYAPMFQNLMLRFQESATPFLGDLQGPQWPALSSTEAKAVCRILLDMPDVGSWRQDARRILPHYREAAQALLVQDVQGSDSAKSDQARLWLGELRLDSPDFPGEAPTPRGSLSPPAVAERPTQDVVSPAISPPPEAWRRVPPDSNPAEPKSYNGPRSGTLQCDGPIPGNAEYVFRDVPLVAMLLKYDTSIWDAQLKPGDGQTQRLILRNKSSGPQKRCVVHWSVIP